MSVCVHRISVSLSLSLFPPLSLWPRLPLSPAAPGRRASASLRCASSPPARSPSHTWSSERNRCLGEREEREKREERKREPPQRPLPLPPIFLSASAPPRHRFPAFRRANTAVSWRERTKRERERRTMFVAATCLEDRGQLHVRDSHRPNLPRNRHTDERRESAREREERESVTQPANERGEE